MRAFLVFYSVAVIFSAAGFFAGFCYAQALGLG